MSRLPDVIAAAAALLALFVAAGEAGDWPTLMQYLYQVPFNANDPLYGKDIGFYLFSLPIYIQIKNWMMPTARAGISSRASWIASRTETPSRSRSCLSLPSHGARPP